MYTLYICVCVVVYVYMTALIKNVHGLYIIKRFISADIKLIFIYEVNINVNKVILIFFPFFTWRYHNLFLVISYRDILDLDNRVQCISGEAPILMNIIRTTLRITVRPPLVHQQTEKTYIYIYKEFVFLLRWWVLSWRSDFESLRCQES